MEQSIAVFADERHLCAVGLDDDTRLSPTFENREELIEP